ncbi:hypothetical protein Pint_36361 [Pistacia integerrima]|uniref:Uncharacterized protein n=1 Tax=Pistacia integerrima TaxID=434235 RepID=A0ACC0Y2B8_9ROSI|nr:hypothetical protein Pint_36361 [Pistacia integerrima]
MLCMFSVSWDVTNLMMMVQGTKKTLILQEMPEDGVKVLSYKEYMATCDVALFIYDSSVEHSWKRTKELLVEVARQGEVVMGCHAFLLQPRMTWIHVSQEMGIEPPIRVSMKVGDSKNLFHRIVRAAEHPHLNILETEVEKSRKRYCHLVNNSLMFVSGSAVTIVGLAAYRAYATRRNSKCQERKLCLAVNFKRVVGLWPLINYILLALRSP